MAKKLVSYSQWSVQPVSAVPPLPFAGMGGEGPYSPKPAPQQQLDGNFSNIGQFIEIFFYIELYDLDVDSNGLHLTEAI